MIIIQKKIVKGFLLFIFTYLFCNSINYNLAFAETTELLGQANISEQNIQSLITKGNVEIKSTYIEKTANISGYALINDTTILGDTSIKGLAEIHSSSVNNLSCKGEAQFENSTVNGHSRYVGKLHAIDTTFKGDIEIIGDNAVFQDSTINGNLFLNDNENKKEQTLYLYNSIVKGTITFKNKNGKVITTKENAKKLNMKGGTIVIAPLK